MAFTDMDEVEDDFEETEQKPPEESSNRTFIIIAVALGALTLLALVCTAAYALFFLPQMRAQRDAAAATAYAQNTEIAMQVTQTAIVAAYTPTSMPTEKPKPTNTPVLAAMATSTPQIDETQVALDAQMTQIAAAIMTEVPTSTAVSGDGTLPDGGFADDIGAPGLLIMGVVLIGVIFLVRRLRAS